MTTVAELLEQARALDAAGKLAEARAVLASAPDEARASANFQLARGTLALKAGDVDAAISAYDEAARLEPAIGEYRAALGQALLEKARRAGGDRALIQQARTE